MTKSRSWFVSAVFVALVLAISVVLTAPARADPSGASGTNTQVSLTAKSGQGSGLVELTMTAEEPLNADGVRIEHVQITVHIVGALPDATYRIARAVDPRDISDVGTPDGQCPALDASTGWRAFSDLLTTSSGGAGAIHFDVSPPAPTRFVSGVSFDIQWQVIHLNSDGSLDLGQELRTECFTITVK
jgi:hypothetical protein